MRVRMAASVALAVGLLLSTAGCTFITPQVTGTHYDPSDGTSVTVGDVGVRNALLISPNGTDAAFVGAVINSSNSDVTVNLQYTPRGGASTDPVTVTVPVSAQHRISFGNPGVPQLVLHGINAKPGSLFTIFVQYGDVTGKKLRVPVLIGTGTAYSSLAPSPEPTAPIVCGASPGATATPGPTATPAPSAPEQCATPEPTKTAKPANK